MHRRTDARRRPRTGLTGLRFFRDERHGAHARVAGAVCCSVERRDLRSRACARSVRERAGNASVLPHNVQPRREYGTYLLLSLCGRDAGATPLGITGESGTWKHCAQTVGLPDPSGATLGARRIGGREEKWKLESLVPLGCEEAGGGEGWFEHGTAYGLPAP